MVTPEQQVKTLSHPRRCLRRQIGKLRKDCRSRLYSSSRAERLVHIEHGPRLEGCRSQEPEVQSIMEVPEYRLSASVRDGLHHDGVFVDEPRPR